MGRYIVWDWNGTLCDDRAMLLDAVGQTLTAEGFAPLSHGELMRRFDRPLRRFFERACDRRLDTSEWERLEATFRRCYRSCAGEASLAPGAREALEYAHQVAPGQFLLSLTPQNELLYFTGKFMIADYFDEIRGRALPHEDKSILFKELLDRHALDPNLVVHIGDTLEDAAAARAVGATPVLVTGASLHAPDPALLGQLQPFVTSTLDRALDYAAGELGSLR